MARNARGVVSVLLMSLSAVWSGSVSGADSVPTQVPAEVSEKLEALITVYTNVYYALGACDGFVAPEREAPLDPYGPMLANWPDSFKRQMAEAREEGRIESARLARQHRFTFAERAELCKRQMDSANADLASVRARYGDR